MYETPSDQAVLIRHGSKSGVGADIGFSAPKNELVVGDLTRNDQCLVRPQTCPQRMKWVQMTFVFVLLFSSLVLPQGLARAQGSGSTPKEPVKPVGRINVGLLKNVSGKCVGTANMGSMENGTQLVIWDCHGNPDQQWTLTSETLLKNVSGKCVGTANRGSMENGTQLVIWDCHGNRDQQWKTTSLASNK